MRMSSKAFRFLDLPAIRTTAQRAARTAQRAALTVA